MEFDDSIFPAAILVRWVMENPKQIEWLDTRPDHGMHVDPEKVIAMLQKMLANSV